LLGAHYPNLGAGAIVGLDLVPAPGTSIKYERADLGDDLLRPLADEKVPCVQAAPTDV
jgi:hypothetical protein